MRFLSACAQGSRRGPATVWHGAKAPMSAGRSAEHDHEKQEHGENAERLSRGKRLSSARQLISSSSLLVPHHFFYYVLDTVET